MITKDFLYCQYTVKNKEELFDRLTADLIAKDIDNLLVSLEKGTIEDLYYGRKYRYYIGQRNIYSNSSCSQNDNQLYSFFYEHDLHPIICYDQRLCKLHYNYLQAHQRQSILISKSNEELQISFFEKQHVYLRKLLKNEELLF